MAQFIKKTFNKFEGKTTIEGMPCLMDKKWKIKWYFNLRRITTSEFDDIVIDIHHFSPDWFFLRNGNLILNIDNAKNIHLDPHESYSDVGSQQGGLDSAATVMTEESCFYDIDKEELKEICDAKHLDIQVTGDSEQKQMDGELFRLYSQAFYNAVIDNSCYRGSLEAYRRCEKKLDWVRNWVWLKFAIGSVLLAFLIIPLLYEDDMSTASVVLLWSGVSVAVYFIARYLYRR